MACGDEKINFHGQQSPCRSKHKRSFTLASTLLFYIFINVPGVIFVRCVLN